MLRVIKNGKSTSVSLGIHVPEQDWDERKQQIRRSHPNAHLLNQKILEEYTRLGATLLRADELMLRNRLHNRSISGKHLLPAHLFCSKNCLKPANLLKLKDILT